MKKLVLALVIAFAAVGGAVSQPALADSCGQPNCASQP
jgi:hypothetical protein